MHGPHGDAIERLLDRGRVDVTPVVAGASNLGYEVRLADSGEPVAFLRVEGHGALAGSELDLRREAAIIGAAGALGFPVPEVLAILDDPTALLMTLVPGTSRPDPQDLDAVAGEYMGLVARLHSSDPGAFPVAQPPTVTAAIEADLGFWDGLVVTGGVGHVPLLAAARRVLGQQLPDDEGAPVLVHGDAGGGNFMIHEGKVAAMLDWEMAHLGDPHEDLAWVWMRGAHTDFGPPQKRISEYAAASDRTMDPERIRWHLVATMWKSCVSMHTEIATNAGNQGSVIHAVVLLTYEALLGAELMRMLGRPFTLLEREPEASTSAAVRAAERLLDIDLPREAVIIGEFLRDTAAHTSWEQDALRADSRRLLGIEPDEISEHLAKVSDAELGPVIEVLANAADRAALATPKAVRRIQRAQSIGLGTPWRGD